MFAIFFRLPDINPSAADLEYYVVADSGQQVPTDAVGMHSRSIGYGDSGHEAIPYDEAFVTELRERREQGCQHPDATYVDLREGRAHLEEMPTEDAIVRRCDNCGHEASLTADEWAWWLEN